MATALAQPVTFTNEPIRTFADPADVASIEAALGRARDNFKRRYPVVIGGRACVTEQAIESRNPAHPGEIVGIVGSASREQAVEAIETAAATFDSWKRVPALERAAYLFDAAERVRARRDDFNALLVYEVGKTWIEADADTAEAIDFLEFYAREALRYDKPPALTPVPGEDNRLAYIPLGVGVVIPPWNFAFAIMAGMTAAALVSGNTVVLKPSSDSPVIAAVFVDLLHEVGVPPGVVNFVPGSGRAIGDPIVAHPKTRFVAFTGSKEVGLHINELAAKTQPGQVWIKRVIAEMGGKDSIVVAADANLDAAADGIVASAFGFAGQKCSACSRAIVESSVYDTLVEKILARVAALTFGDPSARGTDVSPVINESAMHAILDYVEKAVAEGGVLLAGGKRAAGDGYVVEPTVVGDVAPLATIAQEEIFGPVLALVRASDYDDALAIANNTEFGLTGAVYSGDEHKLERARHEFHVGNLYFNRKCTGALVGGHPFGGFNMSGTDSKAGGYDYLALFTQAKMVSEKVDARGGGRAGGE
ncbi:MAG: L-glutamate gamma-semialdehyde dehydrogenase [Candidatus Eremiobacteraeota bacterium]|nr:L-glutamate gamma-semialdehyde dehydrogenase [Candidatus Eremiobacteraeota bacterium]